MKKIPKEKVVKIILFVQCLISLCAVIWLINVGKGKTAFVNGNTGESLNFFEGFIVFNFLWFCLYVLWFGTLVAGVVEPLLLFLDQKFDTFNECADYAEYISAICALIVLLTYV